VAEVSEPAGSLRSWLAALWAPCARGSLRVIGVADVSWPLQEVSRVFGDRVPFRRSADVSWPIQDMSRVFGDRLRRCGRCALAEVSRVFGDRCVADVSWPLQDASRVVGEVVTTHHLKGTPPEAVTAHILKGTPFLCQIACDV